MRSFPPKGRRAGQGGNEAEVSPLRDSLQRDLNASNDVLQPPKLCAGIKSDQVPDL